MGKKRSGFEAGIGITPLIRFGESLHDYDYYDGQTMVALGFISAGYRLQSYNGFMFRSNVSLVYERSEFWAPLPGLSVGYILNKRK